jgi:hypothetical protein
MMTNRFFIGTPAGLVLAVLAFANPTKAQPTDPNEAKRTCLFRQNEESLECLEFHAAADKVDELKTLCVAPTNTPTKGFKASFEWKTEGECPGAKLIGTCTSVEKWRFPVHLTTYFYIKSTDLPVDRMVANYRDQCAGKKGTFVRRGS